MTTLHPTKFAPAERATPEKVLRQAQYFADSPPLVRQFLQAIPDILTVLNAERQIVFANQRLLDFLGVTLEAVIGQRPGEAINCVHAFEDECGCGTTEFCSTCGAMRAILTCQRGTADEQECRIIRRGESEALDLRVWTTPLDINGELFTIFAVTDISHEKRRQALERIFFHDVMNTAGVIYGAANLLQERHLDRLAQLTDLIYGNAERLVEEIETQRQLSLAENNELTVQPSRIDAVSLLQEVAAGYRVHPLGQLCQIHVDENAADLTLTSDPGLLRRIISNMVKNALEASQPGQTVTLGGERRGDQIELWVHNPGQMPRHVQLQVFQRSFSTKGRGRGLGTYSMKILSERYLRGTVTFTSSEEGTRFMLRCPSDISSSNAAFQMPTSTTD